MMMMTKNTVNKVTPLTEIFKGCLEILRRDENWPVDDSVFDNVTPKSHSRLCKDAEKLFGIRGRIAMLTLLTEGTFYENIGCWNGFALCYEGMPEEYWHKKFKEVRRKFNSRKQIFVIVTVDLNCCIKYWIRPSKHQKC